ncbi:receptor-type tyrosine-protein phosphatase S [Cotesia typhae]|uniref:receptor-type tyrosine-protein phosphatase S n=1 Tax=Cotesia typhae TaxID=2053667 RepID=UPI003D69BC43
MTKIWILLFVLNCGKIISQELMIYSGDSYYTERLIYHLKRPLLCISDNSQDAVIWNSHLQWNYPNKAYSDRDHLSESCLSNNPKVYSDYCYLNIDSSECLHAWTQHNSNWSQISSFIKPMGPVFDTRWEYFPEYQTFTPSSTIYLPVKTFINGVYSTLVLNKTGSVTVSIRGMSNAHLAICEGDNFYNDFCYWIIIGGWKNNKTAIRKCPQGLPLEIPDSESECYGLKAFVDQHFPLSSSEWRTFIITWEAENQTISLYDPNKKVLSYIDDKYKSSQKNIKYHVFYRSPNSSLLFRFHEYNYTLTTQPEAKLTSPTLMIDDSRDFCVNMLIGLCRECELQISLLDKSGNQCSKKKFSGSVSYRVDHSLPMWQYGQFTASNISQCQAPLRLEILSFLKTNTEEKNYHWAISNLRECLPEKTAKKVSMEASQDYTDYYYWPEVTCQRLSYNPEYSTVISSTQKVSVAPSNVTLCQKFFIGPYCETSCSSVFGNNCEHVTVCNKNGCFCSQGYMNSDCKNVCPNQFYGYGCTKRCNNCLNDFCDAYLGNCFNGCKQKVDHFYLPPNCEIDIGPPQTPDLNNNNETSIRVSLKEIDDYKKINATFIFELVLRSEIIEIKTAQEIISENNNISSKTYFENFNRLTPGTRYAVRILLNIQFKEIYKKIIGNWRNFTTACQVNKKFVTRCYERHVLLDVPILDKVDYPCPDNWYSADLSAISSTNNGFASIEKFDMVPAFPLLFLNLRPFTKYKISITGNDGMYYYDQVLSTLETEPSQVIELKYTLYNNNDAIIEWYPPNNPNGILQGYNLTIQIIRYEGCLQSNVTPENLMTSEIHLISDLNDTISKKLDNLIPYVTYEIIVKAFNSKLGSESKITFQTNEAEIPTGTFRNISFANGKITWNDPVDCWTLNGPIGGARIFFSGVSENVQNFSDEHDTQYHSFELESSKKQNLFGAEKYYVRVHLLHHLHGSHNETAYIDLPFTTDPKPPPKVNKLEIVEVDLENQTTTLRWEKPSPPTNGEIIKYSIKFRKDNSKTTIVSSSSECDLWKNLLCATVKHPTGNSKFIEVRGYNSGVNEPGEARTVNDLRTVTEPSTPKILNIEELDKGRVFIRWQHPFTTGGPMKKFIIQYEIISTQLEKRLSLNDSGSIQFPISTYKPDYNTQLNFLPSTRYRILIQGVNSLQGAISSAEIETASSLAFEYDPQTIIDNEESQIKVTIPPIVNNTKGCLLHIIVKGPSICKLGAMLSSSLVQDVGVEYHEVAWRAATFLTNELSNSSFTIGNNEVRDNVVNCPLQVGASYVAVLVVHEKERNISKKATTIVWKSEPLQIGPVPNKSHETWAIPLVIVFIITGGVIYYYIKKRNVTCLEKKDDSINTEVLVQLPKILPKKQNGQENVVNSKQLPSKEEQRESLLLTPANSIEQLKTTTMNETIYENLKSVSLVKLNDFQDYVKEAIASGKLDEQFSMFPRGQTKSWDYGKLPQNKTKNRYANLIAYNETRVILEKFPDDPFSDYINANYIRGYKKNKAYIATQGPKPNTLIDFWRMIWHDRVQVICMLANIIEGGKTKCEQYWPEIGQEMKFGKISVTNISHTDFADYTIRIFHVKCEQETRKIDHFHYTAWPDHGIPLYIQSIVTYLKKLLATPPGIGPVLVHCSAGVGRTGTIILCDICLRRAAAEGVVDVFEETELIRSQRANMVDNKQQYLLAHIVLVECLLTLPTAITCNDSLSIRIKEYKSQLQLQQQRLEESSWQYEALQPPSSSFVKLSEKNLLKNRFPDLASPSKFYIARYPITEDDSNYISGVYVDSARRRNNYIASQIPLPTTVGDFWRMIAEFKIELVIMLQLIDPTDPTCCEFFPQPDEELKPVPFITLKGRNIVDTDIYSQQKIVLTDCSDKTAREQITTILVCKEWKTGQSKPPKPSILVELWQTAERISRNNEPTVVICYDGLTGCGLYLAMSFLLERMGLEHECDVCLSISAVRKSRKDFCKTLDQFEYLYDAALIYADYFETYANFY